MRVNCRFLLDGSVPRDHQPSFSTSIENSPTISPIKLRTTVKNIEVHKYVQGYRAQRFDSLWRKVFKCSASLWGMALEKQDFFSSPTSTLPLPSSSGLHILDDGGVGNDQLLIRNKIFELDETSNRSVAGKCKWCSMLIPMANCISIVSMKQIVRKVEFFGDVIATIDRGENRSITVALVRKRSASCVVWNVGILFLKRIKRWSRRLVH